LSASLLHPASLKYPIIDRVLLSSNTFRLLLYLFFTRLLLRSCSPRYSLLRFHFIKTLPKSNKSRGWISRALAILSRHRFIDSFIHLSIHPSICRFIHLSTRPSIDPSTTWNFINPARSIKMATQYSKRIPKGSAERRNPQTDGKCSNRWLPGAGFRIVRPVKSWRQDQAGHSRLMSMTGPD